MGFLSKIFGKKEEKGIQEVELEMQKLKKKVDAEMIAIFGIGGRLKGLPLIYASDDDSNMKQISARLYEIIEPLNKLAKERILRDLIINYDDSTLFFKQIMKNIGYFAIFHEKSNLLTLKQWIYKKEEFLKELLHD
ncbi:MAG: hypothetical protein ACFE8B_14485 [Candidatus Hermodarchaeota archaeon]